MGGTLNEKKNRMVELMGITPKNNFSQYETVEFSKLGADNKVYAIVCEQQKHYIKVADSKPELVVENFKYVGGEGNRSKNSYPTYERALLGLELKLKAIHESINEGVKFTDTMFTSDFLLKEEKARLGKGKTKDNFNETFHKMKVKFNEDGTVKKLNESIEDEITSDENEVEGEITDTVEGGLEDVIGDIAPEAIEGDGLGLDVEPEVEIEGDETKISDTITKDIVTPDGEEITIEIDFEVEVEPTEEHEEEIEDGEEQPEITFSESKKLSKSQILENLGLKKKVVKESYEDFQQTITAPENNLDPYQTQQEVEVVFEDGSVATVKADGTKHDIRKIYIGKTFNLSNGNTSRATAVRFPEDEEELNGINETECAGSSGAFEGPMFGENVVKRQMPIQLVEDGQYKSDEDIENEFAGFSITEIMINPSGRSGYIEMEFPDAEEHVGGGTSTVLDSWIKYDNGNIAFDHWYPEETGNIIKAAIEQKLKETAEGLDENSEIESDEDPYKAMRSITVEFEDGNTINTKINGTKQDITDYYVGKRFQFGDTEEYPRDKMVKATNVIFHDDEELSENTTTASVGGSYDVPLFGKSMSQKEQDHEYNLRTEGKETLSNSDINVEQSKMGGFTLSTVYKGQRYHKKYMDYSVTEAKKLFKQYVLKQVDESKITKTSLIEKLVKEELKKKRLTEAEYKLSIDAPAQPAPVAPVTSEQPAPEGDTTEKPSPQGDEFLDQPKFDAGVETSEEEDPKKFIEQLTGKLAQSMRTYADTNGIDFDLEKYVVNSTVAATHTGQMEPEDKEKIIKKIETAGQEDENNSSETQPEETQPQGNGDNAFEQPTQEKEVAPEAEVKQESFDLNSIVDEEVNKLPIK